MYHITNLQRTTHIIVNIYNTMIIMKEWCFTSNSVNVCALPIPSPHQRGVWHQEGHSTSKFCR